MDWTLFENLDRLRRQQGALLDALGLGPVEARYREVFKAPGVSLRRYGSGDESGPPVLIVPARRARSCSRIRSAACSRPSSPRCTRSACGAWRCSRRRCTSVPTRPSSARWSRGSMPAICPMRCRGPSSARRACTRRPTRSAPLALPMRSPASRIPPHGARTCKSSAGRSTNSPCRAGWWPSSPPGSCARTASRAARSGSGGAARRRRAHALLWPRILAWIERVAQRAA